MIIVSCVVVVLFMAVEERCFPSHTFDDTFNFLDQAFQITVSYVYLICIIYIKYPLIRDCEFDRFYFPGAQ